MLKNVWTSCGFPVNGHLQASYKQLQSMSNTRQMNALAREKSSQLLEITLIPLEKSWEKCKYFSSDAFVKIEIYCLSVASLVHFEEICFAKQKINFQFKWHLLFSQLTTFHTCNRSSVTHTKRVWNVLFLVSAKSILVKVILIWTKNSCVTGNEASAQTVWSEFLVRLKRMLIGSISE